MADGPVILVIDDELPIRRMLRLSLEPHGFRVAEATTGQEGLSQVAVSRPDLVILDLGLPDMDGLAVLKRLREWSDTPVIVLSVRDAEGDKVELLDAGADDYLTKPFGMGELLARIRAALRHNVAESAEGVFRSGGLTIDFTRRIVTKNGEELKLTPTEYSLLRFLARHAGKVCTHGQIIARHAGKVCTHGQIIRDLWGQDAQPDESYLRVYVLQVRRKIEDNPSTPRLLITEPGVGYRLIVVET